MPKQKSHKGIGKRIKVTGTGKLVRKKAGRRHLLTAKSRKRKRNMRRTLVVAPADSKRIKRVIGG